MGREREDIKNAHTQDVNYASQHIMMIPDSGVRFCYQSVNGPNCRLEVVYGEEAEALWVTAPVNGSCAHFN